MRQLKFWKKKKTIGAHLKKLNMFNFDNFITFTNLKLIYKYLHNQAPHVLSDLVVPLKVLSLETLRTLTENYEMCVFFIYKLFILLIFLCFKSPTRNK